MEPACLLRSQLLSLSSLWWGRVSSSLHGALLSSLVAHSPSVWCPPDSCPRSRVCLSEPGEGFPRRAYQWQAENESANQPVRTRWALQSTSRVTQMSQAASSPPPPRTLAKAGEGTGWGWGWCRDEYGGLTPRGLGLRGRRGLQMPVWQWLG